MTSLRVLTRRPGRVIGLLILLAFAVLALAGPYLYPAQLAVDPNAIYAGPSARHWLGTDFAGSDVLQEIVIGARYVLETAALSALFTAVIGTAVGLVAGYHRGPADSALMRLTDFVLTIPGLPLLIVLSTIWSSASRTRWRSRSASPAGAASPGRCGRRPSRCANAASSKPPAASASPPATSSSGSCCRTWRRSWR